MENLKIRVKSEDESKEVQELLFELGIIWFSGNSDVMWTDCKFLYVCDNYLGCGNSEEYFLQDDTKEITVDGIRDMVVLKRNHPSDATWIRADGKRYFHAESTDLYYQFSDHNEWLLSTWMSNQLQNHLKQIEQSDVKVKENTNKLKVEWFEKFLNGVKVQYRIGVAVGSETSQWSNMTYNSLKNLQHSPIEFREAPKYVVLNGITFKDKESLLKHIANNYNLY